MLSYDAGATSPPLLDETIGDNLAATAARFGDREAVVECATGRRWSYAQFYEATRRVATALIERGIKPGDTLSCQGATCSTLWNRGARHSKRSPSS
ncbi:MAG: AMP-binding protein [Solirubrobacteraceae bacterium]